jgi:hypothetical protein
MHDRLSTLRAAQCSAVQAARPRHKCSCFDSATVSECGGFTLALTCKELVDGIAADKHDRVVTARCARQAACQRLHIGKRPRAKRL